MEGKGTDKEQQRQDGFIASDVEGPPTVEETNAQVSTGPDHTERIPHSVKERSRVKLYV